VFVSSSGAGEAPPNVGSFRFCLEEGFYMCGYMAGMMTKSNTVAMIGGDNVPSIKSTFEAFRAGAEAAKPGIKVIETFTGDGQDVAKAKQATEAAIAEGADFVIHQANAAAKGVFDACKEKKVWAFGANLDQNADPSGVVIASAVISAKPAFVSLATKVQNGEFKGGTTLMGMKDGAIDFIVNPSLMKNVPDNVRSKMAGLKDEIKTETLKVPRMEF
jgi:basic membrane protein A